MSRNRRAGHNWERTCVLKLRNIGIDCKTSRYESKALDDKGVDIYAPNFPFNVQCKNTSTRLNYDEILSSMPDDKVRVIFSKLTQKKGSRFHEKGTYAILYLEDFLKLIK